MSQVSWFTGIWRSREDKVYVADIKGGVFHGPAPHGDIWSKMNVGFTLAGIWGLDDQHVYVWGSVGEFPAMARWDGNEWSPISSPDFNVVDLHGVAPDCLVAVGSGGKLSQ